MVSVVLLFVVSSACNISFGYSICVIGLCVLLQPFFLSVMVVACVCVLVVLCYMFLT